MSIDYAETLSKTARELFVILKNNNITIAFAESCTAGLVASSIVENAGSSKVLKGSIIAYAPEIKINLLNVSLKTIETYSAESVECAKEMLQGLSVAIKSTISAVITGVTGDEPTEFQPKGRVFFGVRIDDEFIFRTHDFTGSRQEQRLQAAEFLLRIIIEKLKSF